MDRLAVVEDEELIRTMLRVNLEAEGYEVDTYADAETFLASPGRLHYDALLLDIMLPGVDGEELLGHLRDQGNSVPVLMVTAKADIDSRVRNLEHGADDYLAKPFDLAELLARLRALVRRSRSERSVPARRVVRIGAHEVNLEARLGRVHGEEVRLSDREVDLVAFFWRNAGRTLTRDEILDEVWGMDADPTPRTVDNYIVRLRRLFDEPSTTPRHFRTIRSIGYRFDP